MSANADVKSQEGIYSMNGKNNTGDGRMYKGVPDSVNKAKDTEGDNSGEANDDHEHFNADSHRSLISASVKSLLDIANKGGDIGTQIKVIAQEQNDSNATVSDALKKIDGKGKFMSFLFGADFKDISTLKTQLTLTSTQITQLQALADKTTDVADKATITAQITLLQAEQTKIQTFITVRENKFSLFGWLAKRMSN